MFDVLILGGGPAGLTAGIYSARGGLKAVVIEKAAVGGQAAITPEIENYPGFRSVGGFELTSLIHRQCEDFGVEFVYDEPVRIKLDGLVKSVETAYSGVIEAKTAIIASGATPRALGLDNESRLIGGGVSYCATCDGAFFKGKPVAVAGGGNTAVEDALYLQNFASEVYLIHRRDQLRASAVLAEKVKKSDVKILWDSVIEKIEGDSKVTGLAVKNVKTGAITPISVNGLFVAVGQEPASEGLEGLKLDEAGYVITDESMATNLEGVFAAGDIRQKQLRQVVTAVADGAIAADSAIKFLT